MAVALKKNAFLPFPIVEGIPKALEIGMKKGRKFKPDTAVCKYGYIGDDGEIRLDPFNGCHSGLSHSALPNTEYVIGYLNQRLSNITKEPEKVRRAFTEWLVNFSPFRKVFVTHDIDAIMKDEFVITSIDHPYNLMAGALQAMRAMSEHPQASVIWYELVSNGVHPNLAFYFGYGFGTDGKDLYVHNAGHTGCYDYSCLTRGTLVNILTENFTGLVGKTYRQQNNYTNAQLLFRGDGEDVKAGFLKKIDGLVNKSKGSCNPFAKPNPNNQRWPFKAGCAALASLINEEFKKELENLNGKA